MVTSSIGETLAASFDLMYHGGQFQCTTGFADGPTLRLNISLTFGNGGSSDLKNQLVVGFRRTSASLGDCIQVGGFNEKCANLFTWPSSWESVDSRVYEASVDLSSAGYSLTSSEEFELCIANGDQTDMTSYSTFVGELQIFDLIVVADATFAPSVIPTFDQYTKNSGNSGGDGISDVLLLATCIPVGCAVLALIGYFLVWKRFLGRVDSPLLEKKNASMQEI